MNNMIIFGKDAEDVLKIIDPDMAEERFCIGSMVPAFAWGFVFARLSGLYTIKRWVGTDVYKIRKSWIYRIQAWICNFFIDEHWFVNDRLRIEFKKVFPAAHVNHSNWPAKPWDYDKKFTVMVYIPRNRKRNGVNMDWLYGIDIIQTIRIWHPEWRWLIVDEHTDKDVMCELFFRSDVLLRATRHDGVSRMVLFAEKVGIPVVQDVREDLTWQSIEYQLKEIECLHQHSQENGLTSII